MIRKKNGNVSGKNSFQTKILFKVKQEVVHPREVKVLQSL